LVCNHPDDTTRRLVQYGYTTSWLGFAIIHCWTATLVGLCRVGDSFSFSPTNPSEKSENPWILYDFIHLYPKVVSYILAMWGCWMSYVIFDGLYFPPSAAFWQDVFQSWDGDWMQFFSAFSFSSD
jgi:hypothetical protein